MSPDPDGHWLGIDLGTQSVRVVVCSGAGAVVGVHSAALSSRRAGRHHEQDPRSWWRATCEAVRGAAASGTDLRRVNGVAVAATSGAITLVDRDGVPVAPGLMYDDARGADFVSLVNERGAEQWARSGYQRMQESWGLPKLLWLLSEYPRAAHTGWRLAHQSDVVNRGLIGEPVATDPSNGLKSGVDARSQRWPLEVMSALGVDHRLLPDVVASGERLGVVGAAAAAETGLAPGTPVVAGMTDGCASQLAAGVTKAGDWNSVLGTTLVLKGVSEDLIHDPAGVVYSHRSPSGNWMPGGASSVGAGLVSREYDDREVSRLSEAAAGLLPTDLLRYPLVSPGERFPFVAPQARDIASRPPECREEAFAALLQGVAYVERLCLDYLDHLGADVTGRMVVSGGGSTNPMWVQLRADVLDRPLAVPEVNYPALGMALLAAASGRDLHETSKAMVRVRVTVSPRGDTHRRHMDNYRGFVADLASRGWLPPPVAAHAMQRSA